MTQREEVNGRRRNGERTGKKKRGVDMLDKTGSRAKMS